VADDPTIRWTLASRYGIRLDETAEAWHSGHVTDLLELDTGGLLVATQTGGVWLLDAGNDALPLSDAWPDPDSNCLALGPDGPRHFFAGCNGGAILETDAAAAVPVLAWQPVSSPLPTDAGIVSRIVIIPHLRRIVVACLARNDGTGGGIYWATIPETSFGPAPALRPPYHWRRAVIDDESANGYADLAVAATGGNTPRDQLEDVRAISIVAGGQTGGIYVGGWDRAGTLALRRARQIDDNFTEVTLFADAGRCSVASCGTRPNVCYAACAVPDGRLMQVVRSDDGGSVWKRCGTGLVGKLPGTLLSSAGEHGDSWNNCVAVAPYDPDLVTIGWQKGTFLSLDGGRNWRLVDENTHLHADIHVQQFAPNPPPGERALYVGSDGGVARIDLDGYLNSAGQPFRSDYNRNLATLQCYGTLLNIGTQSRQFYGTITASAREPGLIVAGLQDNGNVFCRSFVVGAAPWIALDGGDGGWTAFLPDAALAHNIKGEAVTVATFDNPPGSVGEVGVPVTQPPNPAGIKGPVGEAVLRPVYRNAAAQPLVAVAALGNQIFGLYADDGNALTPYHWEMIAALPTGITIDALASVGGTIYAGTEGTGRLFAVDTAQGTAIEQPVVLPKPSPGTQMRGGTFTRIFAFGEGDLFAILNGASEKPLTPPIVPPIGVAPPLVYSYVMRFNGGQWKPTQGIGLPGDFMWGGEAVAAPGSRVPRGLVVSTDDAVYISRDDGQTWQRASQGLPRRAHCGDLRFVADEEGGANLYLGTYGRSVWIATLRPPDP
jgi:hypothetical protein